MSGQQWYAGLDMMDAGTGEHVLRACALPGPGLSALQPFVTRSAPAHAYQHFVRQTTACR